MKILLINPPAYRKVEEYDLPTWQHLGIGRLSSYIKQFGHQVTLIDAKLQCLEISDIVNLIKKINPEIIGLTAMTIDLKNAYALAKKIKEINKEIIIVIGGCHATVMPLKTLIEEPCIDYLVFGEGERTFKELLDVLENNLPFESLKKIKGLCFRNNSKVIQNEIRDWDLKVEELPIPDWQLSQYATHYKLETARGCPFQCTHCMRVLGQSVRNFPIEKILLEFESILKKKDFLTMEIVDETFTLNSKRINNLLDGMINLGVGKKIKWYCSTRANLVTKELLVKMRRAGCYMVCFGVESGNPRVIKNNKKNINLKEVEKAVKLVRYSGMKSFLSFILGHPDETLSEMIDSINFATKVNPDIVAIGTMVPYPGTEIAEIVKKGEGNYKLLSRDWTEYNRQFSHVLELNDISKTDMDRVQMLGTLKLYLYNLRLLELMKFAYDYRRQSIHFFRELFTSKKGITKPKVSFLKLAKMILVDDLFKMEGK